MSIIFYKLQIIIITNTNTNIGQQMQRSNAPPPASQEQSDKDKLMLQQIEQHNENQNDKTVPTVLLSNLSLSQKKSSMGTIEQSCSRSGKDKQRKICNHNKNAKIIKSKQIVKQRQCENGKLKRSYKKRIQTTKKQNYKKKAQELSTKVQQLEQEITRMRSKMECCPQCRYYAYKREQELKKGQPNFQEYKPNYDEEMKKIAGSLNESRGSMGSLEFENVDFQAPVMLAKQMDDKAWVYVGALMIAMGSKCLQFDGTINVFRILKQSIDTLRRQVQKSMPNISMDFYMTQQQMKQCNIMEDIGFDPFTQKIGGDTGLALEGVKVQSVEQFELIYDNKITYNIKYQALLGAMEYIRENSWVTF